MTKGREVTPAYIKQDKFGLPCVQINNVRNSRLLEFESPGTHIPAKNCLVRDLWDMFHVYVAPSRVEFAGKMNGNDIVKLLFCLVKVKDCMQGETSGRTLLSVCSVDPENVTSGTRTTSSVTTASSWTSPVVLTSRISTYQSHTTQPHWLTR